MYTPALVCEFHQLVETVFGKAGVWSASAVHRLSAPLAWRQPAASVEPACRGGSCAYLPGFREMLVAEPHDAKTPERVRIGVQGVACISAQQL
jgi:hypothetical protein